MPNPLSSCVSRHPNSNLLLQGEKVLSRVLSGRRRLFRGFLAAVALLAALCPNAAWAGVPTFTVGWSVYAGWNPYYYMYRSGILDYWAHKYGIEIKVQRFDYAASLDAFVAKNIDACTMTNMEALDMPAAAGVDSSVVIIGDYSNGNDAVLVRNDLDLAQLPGRPILLVQKTVSEYLLQRAMELNGLGGQIDRLKLYNTSDSDIVGAFLGDRSNQVAVTWKPLVSEILAQDKGVREVFNSSQIPGEILDLLVIRTDVLNRPDGSGKRFAEAVTAAWYQTMAQLTGTGPDAARAIAGSAAASDDSVSSYENQLQTTYLFRSAQMAVQFTTSATIKQKMNLVREFCFQHGLLGQSVYSPDDVAILYPDGTVQGRKDRVRLRFDDSYMQMAEQGKL